MKGGLGTALVAVLGIGLLYLAATGRLNNISAAWATITGTPAAAASTTTTGQTGTTVPAVPGMTGGVAGPGNPQIATGGLGSLSP